MQGRHLLVLRRGMSTPKNPRPSAAKKQQKPIHSSAKAEQPTMAMEQQRERIAEGAAKGAITPPSGQQLKILFTASAVPMSKFFRTNLGVH